MESFTTLTGLVAPLDRVNVNTDEITPARFLKSIRRTGFANALFANWRYLMMALPILISCSISRATREQASC